MRGEDLYSAQNMTDGTGSPPHARGRRRVERPASHRRRITPACAGKTCDDGSGAGASGDHPRMRGEDMRRRFRGGRVRGSPPHARGRRGSRRRRRSIRLDHPRMRGEDGILIRRFGIGIGSPPHARGRPGRRRFPARYRRITPACAGKTSGLSSQFSDRWDHPRMRGEDDGRGRRWPLPGGSPPHARGRQRGLSSRPDRARITPACAGKTGMKKRSWRGRRITPACAGKTSGLSSQFSDRWDHPRMRGEDVHRRTNQLPAAGLPPHARGRHVELLSDFP